MKLDYGNEEYSAGDTAGRVRAFYVFVKFGKTQVGRQDHRSYVVKHYSESLEEVKSFFKDKQNVKICRPTVPNFSGMIGSTRQIEGPWFVTYIFCPATNTLWSNLMQKTFAISEITNLEHDQQALSFWHQTGSTISQLRCILENPIAPKWPFKFNQIVPYLAMKKDSQGVLSMVIPICRSQVVP